MESIKIKHPKQYSGQATLMSPNKDKTVWITDQMEHATTDTKMDVIPTNHKRLVACGQLPWGFQTNYLPLATPWLNNPP